MNLKVNHILYIISYILLSYCANANTNIKNAITTAMPNVVQLIIEQNNNWHDKSPSQADKARKIGSGVILNSKQGIIVTNAHLAKNAKNIVVTINDGRHFLGKVIGFDLPTDLAIIAIKPNELKQDSIKIGKMPSVGDTVIAIGNPFGLSQTVTQGIVSGVSRHLGIEGVENFIQTDAPINPGNSGGALINTNGKLIGINTAILSKSGGNIGIGFAIPMNMVLPIATQLIKYGDVKRGMIGIIAQNMNKDLADAMKFKNSKGALINKILKNSPAEKSGLQVKDLIIAINENPIASAAEVKSFIAVSRAEENVNVTLERNNQILTLKLKPKTSIKDITKKTLLNGATFENIDQILSTGKQISGAKVVAITPGSPVWLAGLTINDIIISANNNRIATILDLKKQAKQNKNLLLEILRKDSKLFMVLK